MDHKLTQKLAAAAALLVASLAAPATAQIATGNIQARLLLTSTCSITPALGTPTAFTVGGTFTPIAYDPINFPNSPTTFTEVDGTTTFSYTCSVGSSPKISFGAGVNLDGSDRRMKHATENTFIRYSLYSDAGRASALTPTTEISLTGDNTAKSVTIYARAFGGTGLRIGEYTDTIQVTLTL